MVSVRGWVGGVLVAILAGCGTTPSDESAGDGAVLDADEGLDGGRDAGARDVPRLDGGGFDDCASWCRLELDCRVEEVAAFGVFGSPLICTYSSPDGALAQCIDECMGRGTSLRPGISGGCTSCEAQNYRESCTPSRSWQDCRPACGNYDLRFVRHAMLDAMTCAPEGAPTHAPVCTGNADWIRVSAGDSIRRLDVRTSATVVATSPLRFALADGTVVEVAPSGSLSLPTFSPGERVALEVKIDCPFWCEARIVVREEAGALVFATWQGDRAMIPELTELALEYVASGCAWSRGECAASLSGDLVATPRTGAPLHLAPHTSGVVDGLTVHHVSAVELFEAQCTDVPFEQLMGLVVGRE